MRIFFFFLTFLSIASPCVFAQGPEAADLAAASGSGTTSAPSVVSAGKEAFEANCVRCHGPTGAGDGPDAKKMFPRPRDLAEGIFKFRTTASGTPPTDEDLLHTISTGLPGSRMPDFQRLPEETRRQIVAYVKGFSPIFNEQKPEPIDLGKDPGPKGADLKKGKELYAQLGCAACHGNLGRGDGPSAATLADNWGNPTRAANLTRGTSYRGGAKPREIVARFLTGIDGTPMPSYADAVSKEDAWQLAYYVHFLQIPPRFGREIQALKAQGDLPMSAEDPIWQKAARTDLRLGGLFYQKGEIQPATVPAISVQAVYNESELFFRFAWEDPTESRESPADSLAVVAIPDRRMKLEVGSLRNWDGQEDKALEVARWAADSEGAEGVSSYADGQWVLSMKRPLPASRPGLMGVALWDGGNGEQGRRRSNSNWVNLVLKESQPLEKGMRK